MKEAPSSEERLQNLENSYGRVADSMKRFADSIEDVGRSLSRLNGYLTGRMDDETNKQIPGYFARVDRIEATQNACLARQRWTLTKVLLTIKDVFVSVATVFIIWKLGIK